MIRWKYVVPRLVLLTLVLVFLLFAFNPCVRWAAVYSGQSLTGAKVEIGPVRTNWAGTQVELGTVAAADPRNPMQNLMQADRISLNLDGRALSRKQFVVTDGLVAGLQFGTDRQDSGALPDRPQTESQGKSFEQFERLGKDWLDQAGSVLEDDLESNLQSVRVAQELSERWPRECAELEAQAEQLKLRAAKLRQQLEIAGKNPLRNIMSYRDAVVELENLQREAYGVRNNLERMQQQLMMDRDAIATAKQHDEEMVRERLKLAKLDPQALSEHLLGPELSGRVNNIVQWVQWGRQHLPRKREDEALDRNRGETYLFGLKPQPSVLIHQLAIEGLASVSGDCVPMKGMIRGLTSDPQSYGKPAELSLQAQGTTPTTIHVTMDYSGDVPHDKILIDIPTLHQPSRMLGNAQTLAVTVPEGQSHFWVLVDLSGDELNGEIVFKQNSPGMLAQVGPKYGGALLGQSLETALGGIQSIEATVGLSGSLQQPHWNLQSNLGPQFAAALTQVYEQQVSLRQQQLVATAHRAVDNEIAKLESRFAEQKQAILQKLKIGDVELERIKTEVANRVNLPDGLLNKASPLREIFKR
ncbi:MAG: TIGR03545 family protein [Pirellulaceae bacterium]